MLQVGYGKLGGDDVGDIVIQYIRDLMERKCEQFKYCFECIFLVVGVGFYVFFFDIEMQVSYFICYLYDSFSVCFVFECFWM